MIKKEFLLGIFACLVVISALNSQYFRSEESKQQCLNRRLAQEAVEEAHQKNEVYKYYFDPTEFRTIVGLGFLSLAMLFCTLGGISGNLIILPVNLVFFKFDLHYTVAHTAMFSSISGITRVLIETYNSAGEDTPKLINFDVVLLSSTPAILGTFIGVFFNHLCPDLLILTLTVFLLVSLMRKAFFDYKKRIVMEAERDRAKQEPEIELQENPQTAEAKKAEELRSFKRQKSFRMMSNDEVPPPEDSEEICKELEYQDKPRPDSNLPQGVQELFPKSALHDQYSLPSEDRKYYLLLLVINPLFAMIRGTSSYPSLLGLPHCSLYDLLSILLYCSFLAYLSLHFKRQVTLRNKYVKDNPANIEFKDSSTNQMMLIMISVGFVGSFLSAGASTLITFSLILLKMRPFAASPTSLCIGIMYGVSGAVVYTINGNIFLNSLIFGGLVVVASTFIARMTIYETFRKAGKGSIIVLFLTIMMGISLVASLSTVGPIIWKEFQQGTNIFAFKSFC